MLPPLTFGLKGKGFMIIMKLFVFTVLFAIVLNTPVFAGFTEGVAAYEANNLPLAFKEFQAAAEEGHAYSQFNLGLMYEQGIGVGKDEKMAVAWYLKAALQGESNAQYNVAVLYENGRGTDINYTQAYHWYREAAVQGDGFAVGNLGMLYLRGQGVKEDKIAGLALLLLSVAMDNSPENHAKRNISSTKGLTSEIIATAQALSQEMSQAKNLMEPFDQYLKTTTSKAADNSQ